MIELKRTIIFYLLIVQIKNVFSACSDGYFLDKRTNTCGKMKS